MLEGVSDHCKGNRKWINGSCFVAELPGELSKQRWLRVKYWQRERATYVQWYCGCHNLFGIEPNKPINFDQFNDC